MIEIDADDLKVGDMVKMVDTQLFSISKVRHSIVGSSWVQDEIGSQFDFGYSDYGATRQWFLVHRPTAGPPSDDDIGGIIRGVREARGLSQSAFCLSLLSVGLEMAQGTVSKIETGERSIRLAEAAAFARALKVPLINLLPSPHGSGGL